MGARNFIFLIILLAFMSCVEEYWPEFEAKDENSLVVEGFISNEPGPYIIKLSRTRSIDSIPPGTSSEFDFNPVTNAVVNVIDDQGNTESFEEEEPGIYKTVNENFQGVIGKSYKLSISTGESTYESDFEKIMPTIEIESIESRSIVNKEGVPGYQFFVSTEMATTSENYYLWKVEETYEYRTPYKYSYWFDGTFADRSFNLFGQLEDKGTIGSTPPYNLLPKQYPEELEACWIKKIIPENYINSTVFSSTPKLENIPLNFVPFGNERLRVKYSLLVKQHRVSKEAYNFLKIINEQNSISEFDLYTKQPYQIRGNMRNIDNPDEPVLGYFVVSSVSEKRVFALPDEDPLSEQVYATTNCRLLTVRWDEYGNPVNFTLARIIELTPDWEWPDDPALFEWLSHPLYFSWVWVKHPRTDPVTYTLEFAAIAKPCWDCRIKGGSTQKPSYWE